VISKEPKPKRKVLKPKVDRRGGVRNGAGRPRGALNAKTIRTQRRIADGVKEALSVAAGLDVSSMSAVEVMALAMRTLLKSGDMSGAAAIAEKLAPYQTAKISATEATRQALPADLESDPPICPDEPGPAEPIL
jgi:hypothetical protein